MNQKEILKLLQEVSFPEHLHSDNFIESFENTPIWTNNNFDLECGCTKGVIIYKESLVLKIPLQGRISYSQKECIYVPFNGVYLPKSNIDKEWNYCKREIEICDLAAQWKVLDFFAETKQIDTDLSFPFPIYTQPFVSVGGIYSSERKVKRKEEDITQARDMCNDLGFYSFSDYWLADAFHYYGEESLANFISFMQEYHLNDDLHSSNIGYIGDKPVLVDYSGYFY